MESSDEDGGIPFLDLQIKKAENVFKTGVYIKPTNTDLVGNFNSLNPKCYKVAAIRALLQRAYSHSSSWSLFASEIHRIQKLFHANGYPMGFINRVVNVFVDNVVNGTSAFAGDWVMKRNCYPYSLGVIQPSIL